MSNEGLSLDKIYTKTSGIATVSSVILSLQI